MAETSVAGPGTMATVVITAQRHPAEPCQLVLTAPEGVARGASKQHVYNPERLFPATPTRLFVDAQTTDAWRRLGFYSVLGNGLNGDQSSPALLLSMLRLGHATPLGENVKVPAQFALGPSRANSCPRPSEFADYATSHPLQGMPLATTGLTDQELALIEAWIERGAPAEPTKARVSPMEERLIRKWETFLNQPDRRTVLVARYLYEHLFIAHFYFEPSGNGQFFKLVRSQTPPGEDVVPIASRRPNTEAKVRFYYRIRPVRETIVQKTHITYYAGEDKLERIQSLFLGQDWPVASLPDYSAASAANPFTTFRMIPARARYQFMLDDAEYFVRSFIRGPVCRGQVATDVIRDQFWVMFQRPSTDPFITRPLYRQAVAPLLGVPGEDENLLSAGPEWVAYRADRNKYLARRQAEYRSVAPGGPSLQDVWDGDGHYPGALLTVLRHYDNASVTSGFVGNYPKTYWVMDYALLERTYYSLVVNYDVFGSIAHQLQTRLYFDLIRRESELNFLRFLPANVRPHLRQSWYRGLAELPLEFTYFQVDEKTPSAIRYTSNEPSREFADLIMSRMAGLGGTVDPINRCEPSTCEALRRQTTGSDAMERILGPLAAEPLKRQPFIRYLPETTFLTVQMNEGPDRVYSIIRNRDHTNVAFMMGEDLRLDPSNDTITIAPGVLGSYPNFMLRARQHELDRFAKELVAARSLALFDRFISKWGIRRTHPEFWDVLHGVTDYVTRNDPTEAGVLDINRYKNL